MEDDQQAAQQLFTFQQPAREWFNQGTDYRVSSFNITNRTAFILSDTGEITAEDELRLSRNIAQPARAGQATKFSSLSVCKANSTLAVACLCYAAPPSGPARPNKRDTDVVLVCRGDSALSAAPIPQLAGTVITAASWLGQTAVLGTATGCCHLLQVHSGGSAAEPSAASYTVHLNALTLHGFRHAVTGVAVINDAVTDDADGLGAGAGAGGPPSKRCVLVCTAHALFCFAGAGDLRAVLSLYDSASSVCKALAIELPEALNTEPSCLAVREGVLDDDVDTQQLAWLTQSTLTLADLDVRPGGLDGGWELLVKGSTLRALPLGGLVQGRVLSAATVHWHVLLLEGALPGGAPPRVVVVSRVTGLCVGRVAVPGALAAPIGLFYDPAWECVYLAGEAGYTAVLEGATDVDVWRDYVSLARFEDALRHSGHSARSVEVKARVLLAWGEHLLKEERFLEAAEKFGSLTSEVALVQDVPTFAEIVLRFHPDPKASHLDSAKAQGLERYLECKLQPFRYKEQADANASAIATWTLELLCDRLTAAVMESSHACPHDGPHDSPAAAAAQDCAALVTALEAKLAAFIVTYSAQLEYNVLINNLESFGRVKEMKLAARHAGRWNELIGYHLSQGEVPEALELLEKLGGAELESAMTELVRLDTKATCRALCVYRGLQDVDPAAVLRAVTQFVTQQAPPGARDDVIELLEHLIFARGCRYAEVHNCYMSLLAMHEDPNRLCSFMELKEAQNPADPSEYVFDANFALNLAKEHGNKPACIKLMLGLNMLQDAIHLASTYHERLRIIHEVRDAALQQKLWRQVVELEVAGARGRGASGRETIRAITRCVNDSRDALRIEDVLNLFPQNATIEDYKAPLLEHMEAASRRVEQTKQDTASATTMSTVLQQQLRELADMRGSVSLKDRCSSCNSQLGARPACNLPFQGAIPPIVVYPSGGAYHTPCAVLCLMQASGDEAKKRQLRQLLADLNQVPKDATHVTTQVGAHVAVEKLLSELNAELDRGDPMNSDTVVGLIEQLYGDDQAEAESWRVPTSTAVF